MTTHEFDDYCDTQDRSMDDSFLLVEQERDYTEMEMEREAAWKRHGAVEALQNLTLTLSTLILRENVSGDYFFGLHDALEVIKSNLGAVKGGVA